MAKIQYTLDGVIVELESASKDQYDTRFAFSVAEIPQRWICFMGFNLSLDITGQFAWSCMGKITRIAELSSENFLVFLTVDQDANTEIEIANVEAI